MGNRVHFGIKGAVALLCLVTMFTSCQYKDEGSITVTTKTVTEITENSAKTGGSVTSTGYSVGDCGVCYGESHNPSLNNSFTKDHEGDGSFSSTLSNLKSGTKYYVRAYAKTSSGIEYGDETSFTTKGGYTINVFANPTAGGTVTGAGAYQEGQNCTVTATAKEGYTFINWTENGTIASSNESYSFTVSGSRSLTANFSQNSYSIAVSVAPESSGTVTGGGNYNHGQSCTLMATANSGYAFTNWTENGEVVSTNASYTFSVTGNRTLVANFSLRYILSETFANGQGDFVIENQFLPDDLTHVWSYSATYSCMQANSFVNFEHKTESWLVSPYINLNYVTSATLFFEQAVRPSSPQDFLSVMITTEYIDTVDGIHWDELAISTWPSGNNWDWITSTTDLSPYAGQNVTIAFKYTSTDNASTIWRVKNVAIE